jgi:glycopeptide antibiotics resistance protein
MWFAVVAAVALVAVACGIVLVVPARYRLGAWTLVIVAAVVPWASPTDHAHWDRIEWIPFAHFQRPRDVLLNLLLYVPVGWFIVGQARDGRRGLAWATGYAFALSAVTEFTQIFSHGRFPTASDLLVNTAGAIIGALIASRVGRRGRV